MVEPQQLALLLQATFSPVDQERKAAEQQLKQLERTSGICVPFMQIITANTIDVSLRQSAAIHLKKLVRFHWQPPTDYEPEPDSFYIADSDKVLLKSNIVEVLIHSPSKVRAQIGIALKDIVEYEYPEKWPELVPKILSYLTSQDIHTTEGALEALRLTIKRYEFTVAGKNRRKPLYSLVDTTFPVCLGLFNALLNMDTVEAGGMAKVITKIFWSAINFGVPPYLHDDQNNMQWMNALLKLLQKPVVEPNPNADKEERSKFVWWSAKKWAANIFQRLFVRFGDPSLCDTKAVDTIEFSKRFSTQFAPVLLESFLQVVSLKRNGGFLPDGITNTALNYFDTSLRHPAIYKKLKPNIEALFHEVIWPILCFNDEDAQLWEEDPQEYLRRELDVTEEFYNPRSGAINFVVDLARLRGKHHLPFLMKYVADVLIRYANAPANQKPAKDKEGALLVIGSLCDKLLKEPHFKAQIEPLISSHVLNEFASPYGFLRARSCWFFTQYWDFQFQNADTFLYGLRSVLTCLGDKELPVKINAALSLRFLIRNKAATEEIRKILPSLIEAFFKLMNEIDNDELVSTLEVIIDKYESDMAPYAVALCTRLSDAFIRMISNTNDEDGESGIAAMECLIAIQTILRSIREMRHLYPEVEKVLLPLIDKLMEPDTVEYFEEGLKIITFITYYSETISPAMWSFLPKMYKIFDNYGMDFIQEMLIPLDNYISRGTEAFLSGNYLEIILSIYTKVLSDLNTSEDNVGEASKLIEVVILHCKGRIDPAVEQIVQLAVTRLQTIKKTYCKILIIETIASCLFYNPVLTLKVLESRGWTQMIFTLWFQLIEKFTRMHDKKITILGLTSLLSIPFESLPPIIQAGSRQIVPAVIKLTHDLEEQRKANEEEDDDQKDDQEEIVEEDEDADDYVKELDDNENDNENINELLEKAKAARKLYEDEREDSEDDWSDNSEISDDEEYESAVDAVDEIIFFVDNMRELANRNASVYQGLVTTLDPASQEWYKSLLQKADQKRLEAQQAKPQQ